MAREVEKSILNALVYIELRLLSREIVVDKSRMLELIRELKAMLTCIDNKTGV